MKGLFLAMVFSSGFLFAQHNVALMVSDVAPSLEAGPASAELSVAPFELVNGMILVQASVNGLEGNFILDTGSPCIVLNSDDTGNESDVMASGVGGTLDIGEIKLQHFSWGIIQRKNLNGYTLDISQLETACRRDLMGIIGFDVIRQYELFFDYQNHVIRIYDADNARQYRPQDPVQELSFQLNGHIPVVTARVGNRKAYLGLDSGAEANLLDESYYKRLSSQFTQGVETEAVVGLDQKTHFVRAAHVDSSLKQFEVQDMRFLFMDLSGIAHQFEMKLDGLLGFPFFQQHRMSINYKKKKIYLW